MGGEATSSTLFGLVHGAFITGQQSAYEITACRKGRSVEGVECPSAYETVIAKTDPKKCQIPKTTAAPKTKSNNGRCDKWCKNNNHKAKCTWIACSGCASCFQCGNWCEKHKNKAKCTWKACSGCKSCGGSRPGADLLEDSNSKTAKGVSAVVVVVIVVPVLVIIH